MSAFTSKIWAWTFPNSTDLGMASEYSDGRIIYCLQPQYYLVNTSGGLDRMDATNPSYTYEGYSTTNTDLIKRKSSHQYITVSCNNWTTKGDVLCSDSTKRATAISTLNAICATTGFDGICLDFEPFGNSTLTLAQYNNYKQFIRELGENLYASGYKLSVCGPSVNDVDSPFLASLYRFKYIDFNNLPVDYVISMAYDAQWNYTTSSTNSVQPTSFVQTLCDYMKAQINDIDRIVIGMPSYGYHSTDGSDTSAATLDTATASAARTGYGTATRNSDFEMNWLNGGVRSFYQDGSGMTSKRGTIEAKGIKNTSVWVMGGNSWFITSTEPAIRPLAVSRTLGSPGTASSRTLATSRRLI